MGICRRAPALCVGRLEVRHCRHDLAAKCDLYFIQQHLPSGETLLLCRVEDCSGLSHFCVARSTDGVNDWRIDTQPTLPADPARHPEERWGIEDPRIVWVPELERYVIAYTCFSPAGPGVSLASTRDFQEFERLGNVMPLRCI